MKSFLGKITAELFPGNDLSGSFFFVTNGLNAYLFSFAGSEVNASLNLKKNFFFFIGNGREDVPVERLLFTDEY